MTTILLSADQGNEIIKNANFLHFSGLLFFHGKTNGAIRFGWARRSLNDGRIPMITIGLME
ncbi:hypothetical protein [Desulfosarcina cetonica]|uniref:hypothetical protein n=1 Tax=Desulfosarcina cetonica TaxID=90730 RepID=UPI0006D1F9D4|nr:hypothetical protein [Desulfosarcina cetonica]